MIPSTQTTDQHPHCPECDYDLTGTAGPRCPSCGWFVVQAEIVRDNFADARLKRFTIAVTSFAIGSATFWIAAKLVFRSSNLHLLDGVAVLAALLGAFGHAALALRTIDFRMQVSRSCWPRRRDELSQILQFCGVASILVGFIGASSALTFRPTTPIMKGVVANGVFEFFLSGIFFAIPGATLLLLRMVSFREPSPMRENGVGQMNDTLQDSSSNLSYGIDVLGPIDPEQVLQRIVSEPRGTSARIEAAIEQTWQAELALARETGTQLFNGSLVRVVNSKIHESLLELTLSETTYREFLGTNLHNPNLVRAEDNNCFADAMGTSMLVKTKDGHLALGRRSENVAYHAGLIHPFGGMLETTDRKADGSFDLSGSILRELLEEVGVKQSEVKHLTILGIVRDRHIHQPEMLFEGQVELNRVELEARFLNARDHSEHSHLEFVPDHPAVILRFLNETNELTPVAQAMLTLHSRINRGEDWDETLR